MMANKGQISRATKDAIAAALERGDTPVRAIARECGVWQGEVYRVAKERTLSLESSIEAGNRAKGSDWQRLKEVTVRGERYILAAEAAKLAGVRSRPHLPKWAEEGCAYLQRGRKLRTVARRIYGRDVLLYAVSDCKRIKEGRDREAEKDGDWLTAEEARSKFGWGRTTLSSYHDNGIPSLAGGKLRTRTAVRMQRCAGGSRRRGEVTLYCAKTLRKLAAILAKAQAREDVVTVREAAAESGVSASTWRQAIKDGRITSISLPTVDKGFVLHVFRPLVDPRKRPRGFRVETRILSDAEGDWMLVSDAARLTGGGITSIHRWMDECDWLGDGEKLRTKQLHNASRNRWIWYVDAAQVRTIAERRKRAIRLGWIGRGPVPPEIRAKCFPKKTPAISADTPPPTPENGGWEVFGKWKFRPGMAAFADNPPFRIEGYRWRTLRQFAVADDGVVSREHLKRECWAGSAVLDKTVNVTVTTHVAKAVRDGASLPKDARVFEGLDRGKNMGWRLLVR